jgi:spore maturation protein CgeB
VRVVMFYQSLMSDWHHGNAHFLRGVVSELLSRGHEVVVFEPEDGWSLTNLVHDRGTEAVEAFHRAYPTLRSIPYEIDSLDFDAALDRADLVIVHEWSANELVAQIGAHRARTGGYVLLFHDAHHRSMTHPSSMIAYDLGQFDGVVAFGDSVRNLYLGRAWTSHAWTWHEGADTRVFYPRGVAGNAAYDGDLVWIGNSCDAARMPELTEFLIEPVRQLGLRAAAYGVRYSAEVRDRLASEGISYYGYLPNYEVPNVLSRYRATVHIPRHPYLKLLPGVPTIRPFEALACGTPLVSAQWEQAGGLFAPGKDFLVARDGEEMTAHLRRLLADAPYREALTERGLRTVRARHTCAHRVNELLQLYELIRSAGLQHRPSDTALRRDPPIPNL